MTLRFFLKLLPASFNSMYVRKKGAVLGFQRFVYFIQGRIVPYVQYCAIMAYVRTYTICMYYSKSRLCNVMVSRYVHT